jgi:hypothetical protein
MKRIACIGWLAAALAASTGAHADDKAACLEGASNGQALRRAHRLVEAREQFRTCSAQRCPAVVQADCLNWLDAVEKSLPSVVVAATDGAGAPRVDVKVRVDGELLQLKLDGRAVPLNPGLHVFHFEAGDGAGVEEQVLVREGEQNQNVSVVLKDANAPGSNSAPDSAAAPATGTGEGGLPAAAESSFWKTVGWVLAGVGVAGIATGTAFGIVAIGDKNAAHCGADNLCDPGSLGGLKSAALVSDVGWIAGGAMLAGGLALVLFAPRSGAPAAGVKVAPVLVGSGGAAAVVGASW